MSKRIYALLATAVVLGGLYGAGQYALDYVANQALTSIRAGLPPGATMSYEAMTSSLLRREVSLHNLKMSAPAGNLTYTLSALEATVQGIPLLGRDRIKLGTIRLNMPQLDFGQTVLQSVGAETFTLDGLDMRPGRIAFDSGSLHGVYLRGVSGPALIEMAALELGEMKDDVLSSLDVREYQMRLNAEDADQMVRIAHAEAHGVNLPLLMASRGNLQSFFVRDVLGGITVNDMRIKGSTGGEIVASSIALQSESAGNGYRKSLAIDLTGVQLPVDQAPPDVRTVLGLTEVTPTSAIPLELHLAFTHDAASRLLKLETARLDVKDQCELQAKATFSGMSSLMLLETPVGAAALSVDGVELHYVDHGIANRWAKAEQNRLAVNPDVFAEQIMNRQKERLAALGVRGNQISSVLYTFLLNPQYLGLQAAPMQPVSLLQVLPLLRAPDKLVELLRVTITSESTTMSVLPTP